MRCSRCGKSLQGAEAREYRGQLVCEDCFIDVLSPPKACDPWAVRSAQTFLRGKNRLAELTDLQKRIVQFIEANGEAIPEDVATAVGVSQQELAREFATLRHMEILRGLRRGGKIYFALFEKKT
jgi:recombinational DNA repair protein (RecF pathway)